MKENSFMGHKYSPLCDVTVYSSEFPDFLLFFVGGIYTGYRRKSKTLLTIDKRGSKIARHSFFDCHLSPVVANRATNDNRKLSLTIFEYDRR